MTVQKQVMELLMRLGEEKGMAFLFICHDLALVQKFCSRILVMQAGRLVESGKTEDVILHPKEEYTKRLIDAVL